MDKLYTKAMRRPWPFWQEPKPDGLLVRDNLSAHQNKAVKPAIEDAGLTLHYLPR
jgi:transposase